MELDGHMITGWKKLNGVWYYMNSSGQMVTGRQDIKGKQRLPFSGIGCSGYIGWLMYNSIQYGKDSNGYVTTSTNIMQQYYPEWWDCFGKEGRQSVKASTYLYGTKFSWRIPGQYMICRD